MININGFMIEKWSDQRCFFVRYPDGSGETIPFHSDYTLRYVLFRVLSLIHDGITNIFELKYYNSFSD